MILILIKRYWRYVTAVLLLAVAYYAIYTHGYNAATTKLTAEYAAAQLATNKQIIKKLDELEVLSNAEASALNKKQAALVAELHQLTSSVKNKNLTTTKNTECVPSQEFLDSYNSIISRGNK